MTDPGRCHVEARARAEGYWLLASLFATAPSSEFLESIATRVTGNEVDSDDRVVQLLASLKDIVGREPVDALALRLAPESIRLFGGLHQGYGPPPPYESVYRGGDFMGDVTLSVMQAFDEAGLAPLDSSLGPCDHVASELKFMAALCVKEAEAWAASRPQVAAEWLLRQRAFLLEHLLQWLPTWSGRVQAETTEAYFRLAAELALVACQTDIAVVEECIESDGC